MLIFVSYAHHDRYTSYPDLFNDVINGLKTIRHQFSGSEPHDQVVVWVDDRELEYGNKFTPAIKQAISESEVIVLLLSSAFFASDYIREHELPEIMACHRDLDTPVVPVVLEQTDLPPWFVSTHLHLYHGHTLAELANDPPAKAESIRELVKYIREKLELINEHRPDDAIDLLCATVFADTSLEQRRDLANVLMRRIRNITSLTGNALYLATRYCIEYWLLHGGINLESELSVQPGVEPSNLNRALNRHAGDMHGAQITVDGRFFPHAHERAEQWKAYLQHLGDRGVPGDELRSLASIHVQKGFLAAQFLITGLLARFEDDWRPILHAYAERLNPGDDPFASIQTSQWNCWLMWGPSIPICTCPQWNGVVALQFGYGDENNSIPLIPQAQHISGEVEQLLATCCDEGGAHGARLVGRLGWAPFFLTCSEPAHDDGIIREHDAEHGSLTLQQRGAARAQASLYAHDEGSDGLVFELSAVDGRSGATTHDYFSAYLWVMFLVTTDKQGREGPRLLDRKHYPRSLQDIRESRSWNHLLPVFVHANIGDPAALNIQKSMLVENALALLRQVWSARDQMFDDEDVEHGISFHLVAATDYSGCGHALRYPVTDTLSGRLRKRLAAEPDVEFANSIKLQPDDPTTPRPSGLVQFSACHLPDLLTAYNASLHK